ncbi:MAG: gliding motility-associated C-terminal domain-containing protein [Bacteroidetes bacterium]|nr:gliding motility-associated C-terminal domain-containing protein [Bacteroidota bacterium]
MQEQDQIKELFNETFRNFEEPVRPELWNSIASKIGTVSTPAAGIESAVATAKLTGSISAWVAGAAIVLSGIAGYYYFANDKNTGKTEIQKSESQNHQNNLENNQVITEGTAAEKNQNTAEIKNSSQEKEVLENSKLPSDINLKSASKITDQNKNVELTGTLPATKPGIEKSIASTTSENNTSVKNSNQQPVEAQQLNNEYFSAKAYPTIGYAPLAVDFSLTGDIQKAEWDFGDGALDSKTTNLQHIFTKPGVYEVKLKSYDQKGVAHLETFKIEVLTDINISNIPNVFTPNQDGSNDVFKFKAENLREIEITIYDKSGKMVSKFNNPEDGWNGKYNSGQDAMEGTYFYVIFATGIDGQKHQQGGTVTLIR